MGNIKTIYQDSYNPDKTWEVTSMSGGYYLKQFICNKGRAMPGIKKIDFAHVVRNEGCICDRCGQ